MLKWGRLVCRDALHKADLIEGHQPLARWSTAFGTEFSAV